MGVITHSSPLGMQLISNPSVLGAVRSLRIFEVVVDLVEEFARLGKALKWKIYYFMGFSAQASTLSVFFC